MCHLIKYCVKKCDSYYNGLHYQLPEGYAWVTMKKVSYVIMDEQHEDSYIIKAFSKDGEATLQFRIIVEGKITTLLPPCDQAGVYYLRVYFRISLKRGQMHSSKF